MCPLSKPWRAILLFSHSYRKATIQLTTQLTHSAARSSDPLSLPDVRGCSWPVALSAKAPLCPGFPDIGHNGTFYDKVTGQLHPRTSGNESGSDDRAAL